MTISPPPALLPIWGQNVSDYLVRRSYKTDIIISRDGKEQRRANLDFPRKTIEFKSNMQNLAGTGPGSNLWRTLNGMFVTGLQRGWFIPDQSRGVAATLTNTSPLTVTLVPATAPTWLVAPYYVVIHRGVQLEVHAVVNVSGNVITLAGTTTLSWPNGMVVHPAVEGFLANQIDTSVNYKTWLAVDINFEVDPGTEYFDPPIPAPVSFNGREVFLTQPVIVKPINLQRMTVRESVDFGIGLVERFHPVPFSPRTWKASYPTISQDTFNALRSLQDRMHGMRDEFYMPTFENDLPVLSAGANTIVVAGTEVASDFAGSTLYQAVAVFMPNNTIIFNVLTSITTNGINTTLTFAGNWPTSIPTNATVSWLPAWRFASDTLEFTVLFTDGAEDTPFYSVDLPLQMIEDLPDSEIELLSQYVEIITEFV